jgi:CRISPR/Cas system CSM-associated protein Csm3 (group 7 of RAMP superfamily)
MFRTLQNTANLRFTLVPDGPLLIRAQSVGIDPGLADMEFQRTHRAGKNTVFLAGSGLKGVLRSHCERLLRSAGRFACDPTQVRNPQTCGTRRDGGHAPDPQRYPHDGNCGSCFTFGSLRMAGRFRLSDAYPVAGLEEVTNRTEVRTGVGIERRSQAASSGVLYDAEVVVGGAFAGQMSGENFSLWQLGLVLAALEDLDAGLVRIGGAKARGMGSVQVRDLSIELGFLNSEKNRLTGTRPTDPEAGDYGLPANDALPAPTASLEEGRRGLFRTLLYQKETVPALTAALVAGPLQNYLLRSH